MGSREWRDRLRRTATMSTQLSASMHGVTTLRSQPVSPTGVVGDWRGAASDERDRERPDASGAHSTREVFELPGGIPLPKDYTPYPPLCELCSRGSLSVSTMLSDSAQFTDGRQNSRT